MKIELLRYDEATGVCELDIDDEGKQLLMERGFNALLMDALKKLEESDERETSKGV